jgi:AbrB family looped-hinge helix DNA binding protein
MSSIVKVKTKGQVTIPTALRQRAGIDVGDLLEAKIESGKITLTPKTLVDKRLEEGMEDVKKGRVQGPFESADDLIASLTGTTKKTAKRTKPAKK